MPTLDEFREKQQVTELKKNKKTFVPKRYAPYLVQEEIANLNKTENTSQLAISNKNNSCDFTSNNDVEDAIARLNGIKKRIMFYFLEKCEKRNDLTTGPITAESLVKVSRSTYKAVKKVLQNMIQEKLITRNVGKRGKGGFSIFSISIEIKEELLKYKRIINYITGETNNESSSRNKNNENGIYYNVKLDLNPLSAIGLMQTHVNQLLKLGELTPEQIQESIEHFAFDLQHNDKAKTFKLAPLDVFMGMLRKGNYYNAPPNYESKKARNLRLSLESKMKQEQTEKELEEKLKEVEWKEWLGKMTEQELMSFYVEQIPIDLKIPEKVQKILKRRNALMNVREYFESEIWPKKQSKFLT